MHATAIVKCIQRNPPTKSRFELPLGMRSNNGSAARMCPVSNCGRVVIDCDEMDNREYP